MSLNAGAAARVLLGAVLLFQGAYGDLPVHCMLQDVAGDWTFHVGPAQRSEFSDVPDAIPRCGHHMPNSVMSMLTLNRTAVVPPSEESWLNVSLTEEVSMTPRRHLRAIAGATEGSWMMAFDEGIEVKVGTRSFFAHFHFEQIEGAKRPARDGDSWDTIGRYVGRVSSASDPRLRPQGETYACYCGRTSTGWWRTKAQGSQPAQTGCFWAEKKIPALARQEPTALVVHVPKEDQVVAGGKSALVQEHTGIIDIADLPIDGSSSQSKVVLRAKPPAPTGRRASFVFADLQRHEANITAAHQTPLPKNWDWRDELEGMPGKDSLSDQFDQGDCGSCYAFSATLVMQMRFRIRLKQQHGILYPLELSWKSATQCSPYTEGCNGGFAFLAFRQATEVGLPAADCDSAVAPSSLDQSCTWSCYRPKEGAPPALFRASDYGQTGGFTNGAAEESIMREIYANGPVIVSFATAAVPEFIRYRGHSTTPGTEVMTAIRNDQVLMESFSKNPEVLPWRYTTHSILAVGWGEEHVKYWTVRNSWGTDWGFGGYARIRRGSNDAAIETSAPWVEPDMTQLPAGFLEKARRHHDEHVASLQPTAMALANEKPPATMRIVKEAAAPPPTGKTA
eukprot:NODE_1844_length_2358_cov_4.047961.p1 GENE.NODE_1844_length_2358_cov_4.047961~~NODE_1844_length_2358_cov_4.047961.p1  ORF type:complete len:620 (-),score=196.24 NODE_1844_length_2358_cov_4.047961:405-2264(-)